MTISALLTAIAAIPELISEIKSLVAMMQKANEEKWFVHNTEAFNALKTAKTEQEMLDAAKKIQQSISGL